LRFVRTHPEGTQVLDVGFEDRRELVDMRRRSGTSEAEHPVAAICT